ncbi:CAMK family protein kinase [Histomonas meleagridis]|uniref:CAMK family protein kinase n=1 Tax=Histomonas meleagridis TaxID=135588 RepID=UPI00355A982F|nr:CAMK family protein kinase [Histomonas meleagridis]KAH0800121.1 CAMK family protein kinase [Histomonas meleagridis]
MKRSRNSSHDVSGGTCRSGDIQVTIQEKISDSIFCKCFNCIDNQKSQHLLKIYTIDDFETYDKMKFSIELQSKLSHPNIAQIHSVSYETGKIYVLMEPCSGTLNNYLSKFQSIGLSNKDIVSIFSDIVKAVTYMHEHVPPVIHRGLSPDNIFLFSGSWKICEFYSATTTIFHTEEADERMKASKDIDQSTLIEYRSPEMVDLFRGETIGTKSDIWGLGCLLFRLCTLVDAFPNATNIQILKTDYKWNQTWQVDEFFVSLVSQCLRQDQQQRPDANQILQQIFFVFGENTTQQRNQAQAQAQAIYPQQNNASFDVSGYVKLLLSIKPPFKEFESDESDIEMDDGETETSEIPATIPKVDSKEFTEFVFAEDDNETVTTTQPNVINLDVTIEDMINEIFKVEPQKEDTPDYVSMMQAKPEQLWHELLQMNSLDLNTTLFTLSIKCPNFTNFILHYSYESGIQGIRVLTSLPALPVTPLNNYLKERSLFSKRFPMFEGNFSLSEFTKQNKEKPPPVGTPPISLDVVRSLQNLLEVLLKAFYSHPTQILALNGVSLYQASSYVIAKMKQFKVNLSFLETTIIPLNRNQHMLLKKAFEQAAMNVQFPAEPFDYNDPVIIKRLRAPQAKCIYK